MKVSLIKKQFKYVIQPINGMLKVKLQREGLLDPSEPKATISLEFGNFSVRLDDLQYRNILRMIDTLSNYSKYEPFLALKPQEPPRTKSARLDWLKYLSKLFFF